MKLTNNQNNNILNYSLVQECRKITKKYGTSYYLASLFLTKEQQIATWIFYTFVRLPDEIVDNEKDVKLAEKKLKIWMQKWNGVWVKTAENIKNLDFEEKVILATRIIFEKYGIPKSYGDEFLNAMRQDLEKSEYQNYNELKKYMFGSAAVVGLVMTHIIGFKENEKEKTLKQAENLGYAMQLTNFIRDIGEDFDERKRIYMPQDELKKYNIFNNISQKRNDENWQKFLEFQIKRADELYEESKSGIKFLNKNGRLGVLAAANLYQNILREVEKNNYNVFTKRARTGRVKKAKIVANSIQENIR